MKKFIFYSVVLFNLLLNACSQPEGYDSQHHPISLNNYQAKCLIVNYWATWCTPCLTEMPALNNFYKTHLATVMVLGVNFDGLDDQELNQIATQRNISYPLLASLNNSLLAKQDFSVLPVSFVFNPEGNLIKVLRGPQTEQALSKACGLDKQV